LKTDPSINGQLDALFDEWRTSCSPEVVDGFSADGVIREPQFRRQRSRLLFVLMEPNSEGTDYFGRDLRIVWQEPLDDRSFNWNIALWTQVLLGQRLQYGPMTATLAYPEFQRIAIMNLKKLGGTGNADQPGIHSQGWRDRAFIRRQIDLIAPDFVVCGSWQTYKLLNRITRDDPRARTPGPGWHRDGARLILHTYHPATRNGTQAIEGFSQLLWRAREAGIVG
jgi:hypothetical protein